MNAADTPAERQRLRLSVSGVVQGVGFRPFAYRAAREAGVAGFVTNTPSGVTIEAEGVGDALQRFVQALGAVPRPARVTAMDSEALAPTGARAFEIRESPAAGARTVTVLPDLATCTACLAEIGDPANRRYRYPFTNCTQCGPRYSIVTALPYDRLRTTMAGFTMCAACQREYEDPADRRFHAEPNACPACGPTLALWRPDGAVEAGDGGALAAAEEAIRAGAIVAMKGLGGFHLIVDARNDGAVRRLRERKRRPDKPFAVMFPSLDDVRVACDADKAEIALLTSPERPIVLLRRLGGGDLADAVAPENPLVGAMLPNTPLHHLLLADLGFPVVATSGNLSDEPIVTDEKEALARLGAIADVFLVHDRPIARPLDDSVARVIDGAPMLLRRARGYAPAPAVHRAMPAGIVAVGGHLKTTVAVTTADGVVLSQHLGDLDTEEARDAHARAVADLIVLHGVTPRAIVRDLHPDYATSRVADASGLPVIAVQHHLAHVAAAMAEHELSPPVLGVAWDGTGYGTDGTVWGGEFILVTDSGWQRVAHLRPFRLPGGETAVREPCRAAFGLLTAAYGAGASAMEILAPVAAFTAAERTMLGAMIARGINAPVTTSAGRLFDAVSAVLGLRQRATYEGQAAAELEAAATHGVAGGLLPFPLLDEAGALVIDWRPALDALLARQAGGESAAALAAAFHLSLAATFVDVARRVGTKDIALTGGCFQNKMLADAALAALRLAGFTPHLPRVVPPNDGGLALGQAMWAARLIERGEAPCA